MAFQRSRVVWNTQTTARPADLAEMNNEFPGAQITSATVCVFGNNNTPETTPCHVEIEANMNGSIVNATVGRNPNGLRLSLASVITWANKHNLVEKSTESPRQSHAGETYMVVSLVNEKLAVKAPAGFKTA